MPPKHSRPFLNSCCPAGNELGCTWQWRTAQGTFGGQGGMTVTLLQGQPYITARYTVRRLGGG
jgi:hypothetical protein